MARVGLYAIVVKNSGGWGARISQKRTFLYQDKLLS